MTVQFEPLIGSYLWLGLFGRSHRIYLEEDGQSIPLLCLHTAGSGGRQYRALTNDPQIIANHRVIAFDTPWHGKSSPPIGWRNEEYQLTSHECTTMILEIFRALELDSLHSPESECWETLWHYTQAVRESSKAISIFTSSTALFGIASLGSRRSVARFSCCRVNTTTCAHLKKPLRSARSIPGSNVKIMEGLGHSARRPPEVHPIPIAQPAEDAKQ